MSLRKRDSSLLVFIIGSVVLHGLIVVILFFKKSDNKKPNPIPVVVEFKSLPGGSLKNTGDSKSTSAKNNIAKNSASIGKNNSNSGLKHPTGIFLKSGEKSYFGQSFDRLKENSANGIVAGDTYLRDRTHDNPNAPWGQGTETFERIEDYSLFKVIYDRVDSSLSYPGVLARHKISGTVNARFVLDQKGECDWKYTQIKGREPYLQLYVLDLLKRVCDENFKRFVRNREVTNVDLSFQFAISENGDDEYSKEHQALVGNTMMFYRNSQQSVLEWELGPFRGMFPVPAVYLNIPWIQENWDRLYNGKDALKEFKKEFG